MHDHTKLRVYLLAVEIAEDTYRIVREFPLTERYELSSQLRRSSVSISANIAEGAGNGTAREFARYLRIARASASEVDALLTVGQRVELIEQREATSLRRKLHTVRAGISKLEQKVAARD